MIQRYKFHQDGPAAGYTETRKEGDWVRYADHKERVERLEAALRPFVDPVREVGRDTKHPISVHIEVFAYEIETARLALTNDAGEGA